MIQGNPMPITQGWQCPACYKINAPFVMSCDCYHQPRQNDLARAPRPGSIYNGDPGKYSSGYAQTREVQPMSADHYKCAPLAAYYPGF